MTRSFPSAAFFAVVSNAADGDISVFRIDAATGAIQPHRRLPARETVMPLALSACQRELHASTRGSNRSIETYSIDNHTGVLSHRISTPIESSLAYLLLEPRGEYLLGASYGEDTLSLYRADDIARGHGTPLQVIRGIENAHAAIVSADGRFAYVASLGSDTVLCYALQRSAGHLELIEKISVDAGFGPRHMRFSPSGNVLYVLSEFRATVAAFVRNAETGKLAALAVTARPAAVSHLEDGRPRPNFVGAVQPDPKTLASLVWAADIHVTPDGRFVYVSERTSSRLIVYRVSGNGALEYASHAETEAQPRGFNIDPSGRYLVACGEKSPYVAVYAIDIHSGVLSLRSRCEGGRGANWVEIVT